MARYTGAVCRLCRRYGEKLYLKGDRCFGPKCAFTKRPTPPGNASQRRRKVSDRGLQLREKQRARVAYGLLEKQFRRYYNEALRQDGRHRRNPRALSGVAAGQHRLPPGLRGLPQAGAPGRAPRTHQPQRPQDGHPFGALQGRRRRSRFTPRGAKTEYAKIVTETLKSKQAPAWLSLDDGRVARPRDRRADAGAGGSLLRSQRNRGVLLPLRKTFRSAKSGRNWQDPAGSTIEPITCLRRYFL